nr:tail fiber domain-containing protein [Escherichia coli]
MPICTLIQTQVSIQFGRSTSSRRYKKDIETLQDRYADELLSLRPVWYRSICRGDRKDWGYTALLLKRLVRLPRNMSIGVTNK